MFKDIGGSSKNVKFPEKLLKVLEQKLQDIAMGKDPACGLTITAYKRLDADAKPQVIPISLCAEQWPSFMVNSWSTASSDK
jgi:hypothetical protein